MSLARESFPLIIFFSLCFRFYFMKILFLSYFFSRRFQNRKKNILEVVLVCGPTNGSLVMSSESVLSTVCPLQGVSCPLKLAIPSRQVEHRIYCVPRSVVDWRPDRVSSFAANVDFPWEEKQLGRWRGGNLARYLQSFLGPYGFPTVPYINCLKCSFPFSMCFLLFFAEHLLKTQKSLAIHKRSKQ